MAQDTYTQDPGLDWFSANAPDPNAVPSGPIANNSSTSTGGVFNPTGDSGSFGYGGAPGSKYGGDPSDVDGWLAWLATQPGHDPILDTPQGRAYYKQRIGETGGLNANNLSYWQNKATLSSAGGAVGAPEGGGGSGSLWNKFPTLADIQGIPGYQAAIDQATRAYTTGAAAKGTLLNGRTQEALGGSVANQVLSQFYFPFAQTQYQFNQGNAQNLYNLAALGLNASGVGGA